MSKPFVERRQLTVLFCDIIGSSAFTTRLDPEDVTDLIVAYRRCATAAIEASGGFVARFIGDGILAYWGYPSAKEDDPVRAVRAAQAILNTMTDVRRIAAPWDVDLRMRIGIDTGVVVVGELGDRSVAHGIEVIGNAPNVAARLQHHAAPDGILVSAVVRRLTERSFLFGRASPVMERGERWIDAYPVVGTRPRDHRTVPLDRRVLARDGERDTLLSAWRDSARSHGQSILFQGEAGIGKSALVCGLLPEVLSGGGRWLEVNCEPELSRDALQPVRQMLRRALGISSQDGEAAREAKLATALESFADEDRRPVIRQALATLLDLPAAPGQPRNGLQPSKIVGEAVCWFASLSDHAAHAVVFEDVHWADLGTLQFIADFSAAIRDKRILLILTARPPLAESWIGKTGARLVEVRPLPRDVIRELVRASLPETHDSAELIGAIADKSEGNPLFAEELTRLAGAKQSAGIDPVEVLSAPSTLNDYLVSRLDSLAELKAIAQAASVLGRAFDQDLLAALLATDRTTIAAQLEALVGAGILSEPNNAHDGSHAFRHALVRDAAYFSLLKSRRRELHARVARILAQDEARSRDDAALVALHFDTANVIDDAFAWWVAAGKLAVKRGAPAEALKCFNRSVVLADKRSPGYREDLHVEAWLSRAMQIVYLRGNADDDVQTCFSTAVRLSRKDPSQTAAGLTFRALWGLVTFQVVRGNIVDAEATSQDLLAEAGRTYERAHYLEAHRIHGLVSLLAGRCQEASGHYLAALHAFDPALDDDHRFEFGSDPAVISRIQLAWCQAVTGEFEDSDENARVAIARAEDLKHAHTTVHLCGVDALRHLTAGRLELALEQAARSGELARRMQYPYWEAWSRLICAMARWPSSPREVAAEIGAGIAAYAATGARQLIPYALAHQGAALSAAGDLAESARLLEAAIGHAAETGVRLYEAEIRRMLASALAGSDAERSLSEGRQAIDIARRQGALAFASRIAADGIVLAEPVRAIPVAVARPGRPIDVGGFSPT